MLIPGPSSRLLVWAAVTALGAAGCASGGSPPTQSRPAAAATATGAVRTCGELQALIEPEIRAAGSVHLHQELAPTPRSDRITVDMDVLDGPPFATSMTMTAGTNRSQAVIVDDDVFIKGPSGGPSATSWTRLSRAEFDSRLGELAETDPSLNTVPRAGSLAAGTGLTAYGRNHPVELTAPGRYLIKLTPQEWLAAYPGSLRKTLAPWVEDVTEVDIILITDARNRPERQISFTQPNSAGFTFETDYSQWGSPFKITAPPPDQVHSRAP